MKNIRDYFVLIVIYPLCIISLAAVPCGVYSFLVYRWGFTGWLRWFAVAAAAICTLFAFEALLCWLNEKSDAKQQEIKEQECDRYKVLYWEYRDKCTQLEDEKQQLQSEVDALKTEAYRNQ